MQYLYLVLAIQALLNQVSLANEVQQLEVVSENNRIVNFHRINDENDALIATIHTPSLRGILEGNNYFFKKYFN
jgi:hypothetical protein